MNPDLRQFAAGTDAKVHETFGAHPTSEGGVPGVMFTVWAPNAERVSVIGDFCGWSDEARLERLGDSGVWRGFVPRARSGERYKYRIVSANGHVGEKADPVGFLHESAPGTASIVWDLSYAWSDAAWMARRGALQALDAPMSIYEVHLGSWRRVKDAAGSPARSLGYREIAAPLAEHVKKLGFTHVELMPIMEHPFYGSWGYQVSGYFAATHRYGKPQDLMYLIDYLHQQGIGVILDWVPAHFPTDAHALGYFDGTHLYEHADRRQGFHPEWNSFIFNYARHEVRSFLLSSAAFWVERYHADAIRVDGVASMLHLDYARRPGEWIPNVHGGNQNLAAVDFVKALNERLYAAFPDIQIIAEESTAWPLVSKPTSAGGLGFGLKWDMGWMHDTLDYFARDPLDRKHHQAAITFRSMYAFSENFVLPLSHDEVVYGKGSLLRKMPGDEWQRFANLRLLYSYMWAQPGKKLVFMGAELAEWNEWNHDAGLDWDLEGRPMHGGVARLLGDLNRLYRDERALHERDAEAGGFEWVDGTNAAESVVVFARRGHAEKDFVLVALNFTPVPRESYRIGVPWRGVWSEILNSDATLYGGSGRGNLGGREAAPLAWNGRKYSINVSLPPLAAVFFRRSD